MRFVSLALACFVTACAAPANAASLHPFPERLPAASSVRPLTFAATQGTFAGEMSPGESVSILVHLQGQHANELAPFIDSLQNPANTDPHYLTVEEFGRYFGADPVSYGRAIAALRAAGFVIDDAFANRTDISAHAPAVRVEAFFGTPIDRRFERGRLFFTARYEPSIPAALGNADISGLDDYTQFHPLGFRRPDGNPQLTSWTPDDIAAGYNLTPLYAKGLDGTGVTIANSTSAAASESDLAIFQKHFGLPNRPMISKGVGGPLSPSCGRNCDGLGESSLDADSATSIARGATFYQVVAHTASNHNFDLSYAYIVNKLGDRVHIVTTSWGVCERFFKGTKSLPIDEKLLKQAAAEGQFWFSASGDVGTDDCYARRGAISVDFPGSLPYVFSVGGTNITGNVTNGRVTSWAAETAWQYSNSDGASGGGRSIFYKKPSYQVGVTPNDGARDVPDVALLSDQRNDGVYSCVGGQVLPHAGGDSEASPMWAALLAIIQQRRMKEGKHLIDPHNRLYALARSPQYSALFHDILTGNNGVPAGIYGQAFPGFNAGKGFDLATGWGSFNGYPLAEAY